MNDKISDRRAIAKIYERDMDLVLVEELESSSEFRIWLAARIFGLDRFVSHLQATHSVVDDSNRESDVVFRFLAHPEGNAGDPVPVAILLENKIDAVAQPNQGRDYRSRGNSGKDRGDWQDYRTCLVAPKSYLDIAHDRINFDESISYEEILAYFVSRKERDERFRWKARLVGDAILKKKTGYTPKISEEATDFVQAYHRMASDFPRLEMPAPKPRPAGSTWISFRPSVLPAGASIEHQVTAGTVKLLVQNAAGRLDELKELLRPFLSNEMDVEQAGKSVAVVIKVPAIASLTLPFDSVADRAVTGLKAADELAAMVESMRANGVRLG